MFNSELWQKPTAAGAAAFYDYQIANSYRSMTGVGYFARTPSSAGNRKTYTISFWVKRTKLTASGEFDIFCNAQESSTTNYTDSIRFNDNNKLQIAFKGTLSGNLITTRVFRDTSAWMHIVCAVDTEQGTAGNRVKLYINGEQETAFDTETYPAEDYEGGWCNDREHALGRFTGASYTTIGNFYMANFALVDGSQLAVTSFGTSKNGVWIPDDLSGLTWGTTGTWVRFESSGDLGNDSSGNNNDWTNNSVATHDQMLDSPTFDSSSNGGNYCTLNPLNTGSNNTLSEGNLKVTNSSGGCTIMGTMSLITGYKWYFEARCTGSGNNWIGIIEENDYTDSATANSSIAGSASYNTYLYAHSGSIYYGSSSASLGASFTTGDVIGVLVDLESGTNTISFYKDGAAQGSAFNLTGTGINYTAMSDRGSSSGDGFIYNFGQDSSFAGEETAGSNTDSSGRGEFLYDESTGGLALCSGNLPLADAINPAETSDDYPQQLFQALTYTGTGSSGSITTRFKSDLIWIKNRGATKKNYLVDSNRGINSTSPYLHSDSTVSQGTGNSTGISAVSSTSFSFGGGLDYVNASSNTYVAWNWRVNGGTTSTNSTGSHDATQQVDPSGAFSISTMADTSATSVTVGHGLSAAPSMYIVKSYSGSSTWGIYHKSIGATKNLNLNTTAGEGTSSSYFNDTEPTSSVLSLGASWNGAGTLVVYAFANIEGYCKAGAYTGNGSTDGPFCYTGFRPALVTCKRATVSTGGYLVHDNARDTYNPSIEIVQWNSDQPEFNSANDRVDFLANGFKVRSSNGGINADGSVYVYIAMAHNPFKYSTSA